MSPVSAAKLTAEAGVTEIPMLIGGEWRTVAESYEVRDPYRNTVVARAPRSALTDLDDALDAAVKAKAKAAATPAFESAALLRRAAKLLVERADMIAEIMSRETGKAIKDAKAEIIRSQLGDPLDATIDVGTLIDEGAARRVESWIKEAADGGAT
jgi:acyl-CoA reductase-like NAD-dependent aldehyde dehydrogenase